MTLAIALGIPFGTFLAKLIGWREIFLFIALLGQLRCWACRWRCAPLRHRAAFAEERLARCGKGGADYAADHLFAVCSEHIVYSYVSVLLKNTQFGPQAILPSRCWCSVLAR